jgi:protein phosphatase 2C-like protein
VATGLQAQQPGAAPLFAIGDPGRAASELLPGAPGARAGLADVELSVAALPGMHIQAATCRGLQHQATGTPRQDAFAIGRCPAGAGSRAVAAVCDGVGSLSLSDAAARLVSCTLVSLAAAGTGWEEAFQRANDAVRGAAENALSAAGEASAGGMATTAVALVVHREADEWVGEAAWVGDSTLWQLDPGGRWTLLGGPPGGDAEAGYHSAASSSLPSADGACATREFRIPGGALFLMTDGVGNPLRWSEDVRQTLALWWRQPPDPFTFGAQVSFARRTHIDDRTVIGIWPGTADVTRSETGNHVGEPVAGPPPSLHDGRA